MGLGCKGRKVGLAVGRTDGTGVGQVVHRVGIVVEIAVGRALGIVEALPLAKMLAMTRPQRRNHVIKAMEAALQISNSQQSRRFNSRTTRTRKNKGTALERPRRNEISYCSLRGNMHRSFCLEGNYIRACTDEPASYGTGYRTSTYGQETGAAAYAHRRKFGPLTRLSAHPPLHPPT